MSENGLDFSQLGEFNQQLKELANSYPGTCEKHLKKVGNKLKKILKEKSPDGGKEHRGKLNSSWKSEVKGYNGEDLQMDIWSTSPHFHLVDRGHIQKTPSGKTTGFVQGKHFLAAAVQEIESDVLPKEIESLFKDISKKMGD